MLQIGNTVISLDLLEEKFVCDVMSCKGACCVQGDSGAPLEAHETDELERIFDHVKPYMQAEGVIAVEKLGKYVIDSDGDLVTPLIDGKECAYTYFEKGIAKCSIEKAYLNNEIKFRKPISCFLYPVRVSKINTVEYVNYHRWDICKCAIAKGNTEKVALASFLKQPLIARFGQSWYDELTLARDLYLREKKTP